MTFTAGQIITEALAKRLAILEDRLGWLYSLAESAASAEADCEGLDALTASYRQRRADVLAEYARVQAQHDATEIEWRAAIRRRQEAR